MKILIAQAGFSAGGAEKVVSLLARHWHGRGHEIRVVGLATDDATSYFPYPDGVALVPGGARSRSPVQRGQDVLRLMRTIRSFEPDVVVSFLTKVNIVCAVATLGSGVPLVVSERNNPLVQNGGVLRLAAAGWASRRAQACVMQTTASVASLPPKARRTAVVIPNPCDVTRGAPIESGEPTDTGGSTRFVAVGRLERQKGFDLLINAFARIAAERPGATLTIFGEGGERADLERRARRSGFPDRISLPGRTQRPGEWLDQPGIFVMSSRHEGYPNALMEAMAAGFPVVSFDCAWGPADMIEPDRDGLLVPDGNVEALTVAMSRLADDPALRRRLGEQAFAKASMWRPGRVFEVWDAVLERAVRPVSGTRRIARRAPV